MFGVGARSAVGRTRAVALGVVVGVAASVLAVVPGAAAAEEGGGTAAAGGPTLLGTDQLIVRTLGNLRPDAEELADDAPSPVDDARVVRRMSDGAWVVRLSERLPEPAAEAVARRWSRRADVVTAEPDRIRTHTLVPNDPSYGSQWHYRAPTATVFGANLPPAWDVTTGSESVVVAVLDTGRLNHADMAGKWVGGYDFIWDSQVANDGNGRDADPSDPGDWITSAENSSGYFEGCGVSTSSWHGTHVAGTIGAATNNGVGVAGVGWNVKVLPVRVLGKCGGYDSDIIDGLRWAAGLSVSGVPANPNPAQVLNLSLGGLGPCTSAWQSAINAVTTAGATVVVAAGNENINVSGASPGNCNNVITVAASGSTGSRAFYSNYGAMVEITAPGGDSTVGLGGVLSTLNTGTQGPVADSYAWYQGTSMAAPHVAGAAALIKSVRPAATPAQVLAFLQQNVTAFPAGSSCTPSICGTGILNVSAAVRAALTVPGAPGTPSVVAGDGQVAVSWSAPSSDGGSAITGYVVTPYIGAVAQAPRVFASGATSQVVTGLVNGTSYTFRVAASNVVGTGAQSAASGSVTPVAPPPPVTVPGAPGTPSVVAGDGQVAVSWSAPSSDGGSAITGYVVTPYVGAVAQAPRVFASAATSQVVSGLVNGTSYTFRVAASNVVGTGAQSAASGSVTPVAPPPPPPSPAPFPSWSALIERLYLDITATAPTSAEVATWTAALSSGAKTKGELIEALRRGTDNTVAVDPGARLYRAFLQRTPDAGGFRFWVNRRRTGTWTLVRMADHFSQSSEFTRKYGTLSNRQFVTRIYTDVLERTPDAAGVDYWTRQLDQRRRNRGSVMVGFSESNEYKRKQAENTDVAVTYIFLMGRPPTASELTDWTARQRAGTGLAVLADELVASAAYASRITG